MSGSNTGKLTVILKEIHYREDRDLPREQILHLYRANKAMLCSFECTYCNTCAETVLRGICPNCGGELVRGAVRPAAALITYPASTERVVKEGGCQQAA